MKHIFKTELLKALHLLTRDGKLNQDANRKLKQIHHLANFIQPLLPEKTDSECHLWDLGSGKSYLGFLLYDLFLTVRKNTYVHNVESRNELIEFCKKLKTECDFERMNFHASSIQDLKPNPLPHMIVMALHACDQATDQAIQFGLQSDAKHFVLVPCCQAQIARILHSNKSQIHSDFQILWQYPLHTREFASHLTNVLRTLYLQSYGYRVTVTEFVGLEHSVKNELILAEKISSPDHPKSKESLRQFEFLTQNYHLQELGWIKPIPSI